MADHSALPWVVWSVENEAGTKWSVCHHVGGLGSETHECVATIKGVDAETAEANARFIVTACNLYHGLIAALQLLMAQPEEQASHDAAWAALAKVQDK